MTDLLVSQLANAGSAPGSAERGTSDQPSVTLVYRGPLADSTEVFLIQQPNGASRAIALLSSESAPGMVARASAKARAACELLGSKLGSAVLLPTAEGAVEGRSYAITPHCRTFGSPRVRWWLERVRLRRVMLQWLAGVVSTTAALANERAVVTDFEQPLERLLQLDGVSERLRDHARAALQNISTGAWRPRHVLMHGDLWSGNLLLRRPEGEFVNADFAKRVAVIDWAGSKTSGYPIVDLIRIASSLRLPSRQLRSAIRSHAALLQCTERDCIGYLLASHGCLLGELDEFPIERFRSMAESSLGTLLEAINADDAVARS